jgi:uncharacterized protein YsxB (DUF464 family)
MIQVKAELQDGCLVSLSSDGHASTIEGISVPCAIVSSVLKHAGLLLTNRSDIVIDGSSTGSGNLELCIRAVEKDSYDWLKGVQDLILSQLEGISQEFPGEVALNIVENNKNHR